jgi:cell wall-associated NlpC family hydrolase
MGLTDTQRVAVVTEAKAWQGTPYRGWSCLKTVGTDCGQLIYGVYRALGLVPVVELPVDYSLQVAQHQASTEYVDLILKFFREVPESEAKPGDLVAYKLGLAMAHAGIIVTWPEYVIQAELRHGVSGTHGTKAPRLTERWYTKGTVRCFFTLQDAYCKGGF